MTRAFRPEIDTNIFWAASVVSRAGFAAYFAPYYLIGVSALFIHLAAFIALRKRRRHLAAIVALLGCAFSLAIVLGLLGFFDPVILPPEYEAYLDNFW